MGTVHFARRERILRLRAQSPRPKRGNCTGSAAWAPSRAMGTEWPRGPKLGKRLTLCRSTGTHSSPAPAGTAAEMARCYSRIWYLSRYECLGCQTCSENLGHAAARDSRVTL